MLVVPFFWNLSVLFENIIHLRTSVNRKPERWLHVDGEISKNFQRQVGNRNLKDTETQTEISIALSSPANSVSAAFLTARKLPDVFRDKTVRLCEPVCPWIVFPNLRNSTV